MIKPIIQDKILFPETLWHRSTNIYQRRGRVLVIGGERNPNEIIAFSEIIYNCRIGKLTLAFPDSWKSFFNQLFPENILQPLSSSSTKTFELSNINKILELTEKHDLIVIGIGLSQAQTTKQLIEKITRADIPILALNYRTIRLAPTINFINLPNKDYPILEIEKLLNEEHQTIMGLTNKGSYLAAKDKIVMTPFNVKDSEIILQALTAAIWSFNIQKPFESACTASYLTKIYCEGNHKITDIDKIVKMIEKQMEEGKK